MLPVFERGKADFAAVYDGTAWLLHGRLLLLKAFCTFDKMNMGRRCFSGKGMSDQERLVQIGMKYEQGV
jgi:hypothetical protein